MKRNTQHNDIQLYDIPRKSVVMLCAMLSVFILCVTYKPFMMSVVMLNVIMPSVVVP
jgi:hypothetical protein